ncbi:hypothetical protein Ddc_15305 [Ditylenchus destructor]|nr:hypothetical protein Ddc_15305 [Ditylenchus destructor]
MEIDPLLASGRSHNGNQSLKVRVFPNSGANSAGLLPGRERKAEQTSELMDRRTGKNGKTQSKSQNGHFWSGQYALDEIGKGNAKSESNAPREQKNHNGTAAMAKNTSGELDSKVTKGSLFASATADSSHHQSIMTQCRAVCLAHSPEPSAAPKHYNNTGIGAQNSALPDSHQKMLGPKSLPKNGSDPRSTEYTYVKKAVPRGLKKHIVQSLETPNGQEFRRNGDKFEVMTLPSPAMLNNQLISVVHFKEKLDNKMVPFEV